MEWIALVMVGVVFLCLVLGFPVAFTLAGVATITGLLTLGPDFFNFLPSRIMGIMSNYVLLAVPLFVFMGIMLEKSGMAATLLKTMAQIFGKVRGGLGVSVIIVGTLLAASTGIVGATVVTMGLISLPSMIESRYNIPLATGIIASSGTLGQIIPPSIVLILLGTVLNVSVGDLFLAAILPGLIIVGSYIIYVLVVAKAKPEVAPPVARHSTDHISVQSIFTALLMPLFLMVAVLGSIFAGVASPTEAAAVGAFGAVLLTVIAGKFSFKKLVETSRETTRLTTMVFFILIGATTFSLVFRGLHGDDLILELIQSAQLSPDILVLLILLIVFILGFFIDFVEIIFIIVPIVLPILNAYEIDLLWVGILLAINLQTSFLTPPFGFSLFYLKGVAPPEVKTRDIYRGIIPFIIIQLVVLTMIYIFPSVLLFFTP
ncbi:TRAP transporter large permease subunit [Membranicola marinus]|uniref:TRAP transporter large permease subunit n=1 Tax=Membranihabitans marinus TaxID=1227546 RepID=A0A953HWL3_9BACT|nr:TRAP transporter large permease subunit [Membranihabitans marinus]MBY5957107.1 TRAP transporter large permease subunit [Membranihabitans marinus]